MATGAAIFEFGTNATVISDAANGTDPQFSVTGDATALVQTNVSPLGDALLDITLTANATAGDAVHLYRRDMNVNGTTSDASVPDATNKSTYVGSFPLDLVSTRQYVSLTDIPLVTDQEFYIEYDLTATSGTQTNATVVMVRPKTYNAEA